MKDDVDAETEVKLKLVERELAWESEKNLLSLQKLKKRSANVLEFSPPTVHLVHY